MMYSFEIRGEASTDEPGFIAFDAPSLPRAVIALRDEKHVRLTRVLRAEKMDGDHWVEISARRLNEVIRTVSRVVGYDTTGRMVLRPEPSKKKKGGAL